MKTNNPAWGSYSPAYRASTAISVVELIVTVAVIGLVATVSILAVGSVSSGAHQQKVETDVKAVNAAITMYLANGGDLEGVKTAEQVLNKLKTSRTKADKSRHTGAPSGKMIDPRVATRRLPVNSSRVGAVYDAELQRFETVKEGVRFEFILDEQLNEYSSGVENRDHTSVTYAKTSSWVWDHAALQNPKPLDGPDTVVTGRSPADSVPATAAGPPHSGAGVSGDDQDEEENGGDLPKEDPPLPSAPRLPTPVFSEKAGGHPDNEFPLSVSISNIPAGGVATTVYKVNGESWQVYGSPVTIPMNTTLSAQFLTNDSTLFRDSNTRSALYFPVPTSLNGTVDGAFESPTGGPNLVYDIENDGKTLSHGNPVYLLDGVEVKTGDPNVLRFTPGAISSVAPGQKFTLGILFYHNGSSYYDSHATNGTLSISIRFSDLNETVDLDLKMDMVNTPNDPDDLAASADYVKILNLTQNISLNINGVPYQMNLEFGATDSFGFSSTSQFHVYEGATGQGEILGTFLASP